MAPLEWAMLVGLSVLWGGSFVFNGVLVRELPPPTIVLGRVALASAVLLALVYATGQRMPATRAAWGGFLVMGALNNLVPFGLIIEAQTRIAGGLAAILMATTPLFTAVLAHLLTRDPKERLTRNRVAGLAAGLAGVAVIMGPSALAGLGQDLWAQAAMVAASVSYGCANVFGRRLRGTPPLVAAAGQVSATALMALPVVLVLDRPWTIAPPSPTAWAALLGLALLCTVLGYVLFFAIIGRAGATNVSLVTLLIPVSAVVLGGVVLGERLQPHHFAGMASILAGLLAADGRLLRRCSAGVA